MTSFRSRSWLICGALILVMSSWAGSAFAGIVQTAPFSYLSNIFNQDSMVSALGGQRVDIRINASQTLYSPQTFESDGAALDRLVAASGLGQSLTIPTFYVDSMGGNTVGLGFVGDNGLSLLTSFQETLQVRPEGRDYEGCARDFPNSRGCYYVIPAITEADITRGLWRSAIVLAHEIGHNFGLGHSIDGLMGSYVPSLLDVMNPLSYSLSSFEVDAILRSPLLQFDRSGGRFIEIAPFSVLLATAVPEPSTLPLVALALLLRLAPLSRQRRSRRMTSDAAPQNSAAGV